MYERTLSPEWQWPIGARPQIAVDSTHGGWLELTIPPDAQHNEVQIGQRAPPGKYVASTAVEVTTLDDGVNAGISAYASVQQLVALTASRHELALWSREGGREMVLARIDTRDAKRLELRMTRTPEAGFRFAFRTDRHDWQPVVTSSGTDAIHKPNSNPIRIALITIGPSGASARFGYFRLERW